MANILPKKSKIVKSEDKLYRKYESVNEWTLVANECHICIFIWIEKNADAILIVIVL